MLSVTESELARKSLFSQRISQHPCYGSEAHFKYGRIHLPVVSSCNIGCNYCVRKYDCVNESRPGVASKIITAEEAIERVRIAAKKDPRLRVVGIAGPGDPLSSNVTFNTLRQVQKEFPHFTRCISTNGLMLPDKLDQLKEAGVTALTITINATDPEVGSRIYSFVRYKNQTLHGKAAFKLLNEKQLEGLREAADVGIVVKVNSVYIPGVNAEHLIEVAKTVRNMGAYVMNIMPLIPQAKFAHITAPSMQDIRRIRYYCEGVLFQFHNCIQCRADAVGVPGEALGSHYAGLENLTD